MGCPVRYVQQFIGKVPLPWTVMWSEEERSKPWKIAACRHARGAAVIVPQNAGVGKPIFGATHPDRQREAVARCLCEMCGKSLKLKTKVSLSEERETFVEGLGAMPLLVEPLCCAPCAHLATLHCPHLKARVKEGKLNIRQVFAFKVVKQLLNNAAIREFCGDHWLANETHRYGVTGHLKMALTKQALRSPEWLEEQAR